MLNYELTGPKMTKTKSPSKAHGERLEKALYDHIDADLKLSGGMCFGGTVTLVVDGVEYNGWWEDDRD